MPSVLLAQADAVHIPLKEKSVHCCVCSPPYWGLRDYGTGTWEGGDAACDHAPDKRGSRFATPVSHKQRSNAGSGTASRRDCSCGASRVDAQLGLEPVHDCLGWATAGPWTLRDDLTEAEVVYVYQELKKHGVL